MELAKKPRIVWIDIAKGIAILFTVVGHTFPYASFPHTLAYSFHMPLFFILSGFTFRPACSWRGMAESLKKDALRLLVPCLVTLALVVSLRFLFLPVRSMSALMAQIKENLLALFWASSADMTGVPRLGILWFLIVMFWARQLMNVLALLFPGKEQPYLIALLGTAGVYIGQRLFLPQSMDVVPVAMLFMGLGMLWRQNEAIVARWSPVLFAAALLYWSKGLSSRLVFAMGDRIYPGTLDSLLYACCGAFIFCCLSKALVVNQWISKSLSFIGRHTLLLLFLHKLDFALGMIWRRDSQVLSLLLRFSVLFAFFFAILGLQRAFAIWRAKRSRPSV